MSGDCEFKGHFTASPDDILVCAGKNVELEEEGPPENNAGPGYFQVPPDMVPNKEPDASYVDALKQAETKKPIPCYLPQDGDDMPATDQLEPMGPIGPWATGKVDWSPLAGLTGTRPVVDRYTITRFSPLEWRERSKQFLKNTYTALDNTNKNADMCKNTLQRTYAMVNKTQLENSRLLSDRAQLVYKWKIALEVAIQAMIDEISTLEEQRLRLKKSLLIFGIPESIVKECIERRSTRPETELVRDSAEEELVKELAMIAEIRSVLLKTLKDIEQQQIENRTARERMEYDWSDKQQSYEIETVNVGLNNDSKLIMFKPGAVRSPPEQSSLQYWEHFTTETLEECEKCRNKSIKLRGTLDAILLNAGRDLRTQADVVEKALVSRISCMELTLNRLESDLRDCLQKLADCEHRIERMSQGQRGLDSAMKLCQTRLDNRSFRPHAENCRDQAQMGFINEVKSLQDSVSAVAAALDLTERNKTELMITRSNLEREIMLKRRALMLDRDRCMVLRSHFPSVNALSGFEAN